MYYFPYGIDVKFNPGMWVWYIWMSILTITILITTILHYRRQTAPLEKKQARAFLTGTVIVASGGLIFDLLLTSILPSGTPVPPMAMYLSTIQSGFFVYGLLRYRLFSVNPATTAEKIIETMSEPVIVTDASYHVLFSNERAKQSIGASAMRNPNTRLSSIFSDDTLNTIGRRIVEETSTGQVIQFHEIALFGTSILNHVNISISGIATDDNKLAGIVWVFNDVSRYKEKSSPITITGKYYHLIYSLVI